MDPRVRTAIDFMNANPGRKLTSTEIAQSVRLTPAYLRQLFKNETGQSLAAYRKQLQLEGARHLLETTFLSVKEITATVGLGGVSHFVRDFQRKYGATPSRYAERHRKSTQ